MSTIGSDPRNSWRPQKDVPNGVVIKIVRGHQIRRFTLEPSSSFAQLERQITARFGLTGRFRLRYEDDESEMCTVGCDNELLEAMRLAALTTPPVLRVQVEDEGTPSVATAEPASATKTDDVHVVVQRTPHTCHAYGKEPPLATKTDSVASLPNHDQADGTDLLREHEVTSSSIHTIRSHFLFRVVVSLVPCASPSRWASLTWAIGRFRTRRTQAYSRTSHCGRSSTVITRLR